LTSQNSFAEEFFAKEIASTESTNEAPKLTREDTNIVINAFLCWTFSANTSTISDTISSDLISFSRAPKV
jgi:TolB-like protein